MTMALKSKTFQIGTSNRARTEETKKDLLTRHQNDINKVLKEARAFSEDRRRTLDRLKDKKLVKIARATKSASR